MVTPVLDATSAGRVLLDVYQVFSPRGGAHGLVEITTDLSTWTVVADLQTASSGRSIIDVTAVAGQTFRVRFGLVSSSAAGSTWILDDVKIVRF